MLSLIDRFAFFVDTPLFGMGKTGTTGNFHTMPNNSNNSSQTFK